MQAKITKKVAINDKELPVSIKIAIIVWSSYIL
jgi:hypothetical protein